MYLMLMFFFAVTGLLFVSGMEYFALRCFQLMGFGTTMNITRYVYSAHFHNTAIVLLFMIPALTMRLFSEERKQGTMELLYTSPISSFQLVMGKFLSAAILVTFMIIIEGYTLIFGEYLSTLDWGRIATSYTGLFLFSLTLLSIGTFTSSFSGSHVTAGASAFAISLIIWLFEWMGSNIGGRLGDFLYNLSFFPHYNRFLNGILDTRDIVYYISMTIFFIFSSWVSLELERRK